MSQNLQFNQVGDNYTEKKTNIRNKTTEEIIKHKIISLEVINIFIIKSGYSEKSNFGEKIPVVQLRFECFIKIQFLIIISFALQ